jgi:hypothetical protein
MKNLLFQEIEIGDLIFDYSPCHNCCQLGVVVRKTNAMLHCKFVYAQDRGRKIKPKYALKVDEETVLNYIQGLEEMESPHTEFINLNKMILNLWRLMKIEKQNAR